MYPGGAETAGMYPGGAGVVAMYPGGATAVGTYPGGAGGATVYPDEGRIAIYGTNVPGAENARRILAACFFRSLFMMRRTASFIR